MDIAVCGTGYVGLVATVAFAAKGHTVIGMDIDQSKIDLLNAGVSPLFEPGLEDLLRASRENLVFTSDPEKAYQSAEIVFIAVPTPEMADGNADLAYVESACEQIIAYGSAVRFVVVKSTVPPGTNAKIQALFDEKLAASGKHMEIISNPEFLSQGTALRDMMHPSRVVVGVASDAAAETMKELYESFEAPILIMDIQSSEMVKYASNDFLALKISYINEIANLCDVVGADVQRVAQGMGADPRIGSAFLQAGIGYGGSCFPKDTKALHWLSTSHGREIKTVKAAIEVNKTQKLVLLSKARERHGSLQGKHVAVLGLSFKPQTDDLRDAPSLDVVESLLAEGSVVVAYDPCAMEAFNKVHPQSEQISYASSALEALKGADMAFLLTEWEEIASINQEEYINQMKTAEIYDGRNMYSLNYFFSYPAINYISIGRPCLIGNLND
ncbi:MAG: UDP-glucose/GDP-mannose dehydrogenase family protein [Raoultibacter sp.]